MQSIITTTGDSPDNNCSTRTFILTAAADDDGNPINACIRFHQGKCLEVMSLKLISRAVGHRRKENPIIIVRSNSGRHRLARNVSKVAFRHRLRSILRLHRWCYCCIHRRPRRSHRFSNCVEPHSSYRFVVARD